MLNNFKTLLVTLDFPPLLGGVANYYFERVKNTPQGEIVVLMNQFTDYRLPTSLAGRQITDDDFKIYYKSFFTKFIWPHWLPLMWQIYKIIKKEKINKIWVGQILPVGTAVWVVCWFINNKILRRRFASPQDDIALNYFVTCHGNDLLRAKNQARKFKLAKRILKDAEFVEANTEFTKNILINDFEVKAEKIKIVYPMNTLKKEMADDKIIGELREKYNLQNKKVLLTVGRLVESKGIDRVMRALPLVLNKIPNLVYLIIGDGPDKNRLIKIANELLLPPPPANRREAPPSKGGDNVAGSFQTKGAGEIIFVGALPHNELANYYALADAFILIPHGNGAPVGTGLKPVPDTESFGIVFLEAQEFNLPIIASDVGGIKEAVSKYDKIYFVDPENSDDLADNIIKVLEK